MSRFLLPAVMLLAACAASTPRDLSLATTTSIEDAGLLEALVPAFEAAHPEHVLRAMATGSGQAFELGRRGDVDVLITHAPAQESAFVREGNGVASFPIMHNRFVIVGPEADPARVRDASDAAGAFRRIADSGSRFVSRGDDSGTHVRERTIWESAGIVPREKDWYVEAGLGMGDVLRFAGERGSYTLSDRATFVAAGAATGLVLLLDATGDSALDNRYSVTAVAGARNADGARAFVDWIRSPAARALIGGFRGGSASEPLFVPASR